MNIVYSTSDFYSECTGVSLWSLYESNEQNPDVNVYILCNDVSTANKNRFRYIAQSFRRTLTLIDAADDFKLAAVRLGLPLLRGSYSTYARVVLNTWFSDLDKIIVIDSDTMVTGDLSDLWNFNLGGMLFGAVPEIAVYTGCSTIEDPEVLDAHAMYYNMGIVVVNLAEWRNRDVDRIILKAVTTGEVRYRVADQSIINQLLGDCIARVPLRFNFYTPVHYASSSTLCKVFSLKTVFSEEELLKARKDPVIIHYFGHPYERPWFKHSVAFMSSEYRTTRAYTPWESLPLQGWPRSKNLVFWLYDRFCYFLLKVGLFETSLKFRYLTGQKLKRALGMAR